MSFGNRQVPVLPLRRSWPDRKRNRRPRTTGRPTSLRPFLERLEDRRLLAGDSLASIHGFKWEDIDGDGSRDNGEPGIAGVTIYVDANLNAKLDKGEPRTTTLADDPKTGLNESGRYWLTNLPAGQHVVREVVPNGFDITFPKNNTHFVQLKAGGTVDGIDFGNQSKQGSSIHGLKWRDDNGNGLRDANEPGLAGVTIYVDFNLNHVLDVGEPHTTTIADNQATQFNDAGQFWLTNLPAGQHVVREVIPSSFDITFPKNNTHVVHLNAGGTVEGIDFGNQPKQRGSVHGTKWRDDNGNGQRDAKEPGLAGVTIYVDTNLNHVLDAGEPHTTTMADDPTTGLNESGRYWLTNLPAGQHVLREVIPNGFVITFPKNNAHVIQLKSGGAVEGIDFGNQPTQSGSVHGTKWRDDNGNGRRDLNEPGLAGVTIYVDTNLNHVLDAGEPRTTTMADDPQTGINETGRYWLTNLPAGQHVVREVIPNGFDITFPKNNTYFVQLKAGGTVDGIDFGNQPGHGGSVHGTKWRDDNGNGRRDVNEPGLAGVTIYVDTNLNHVLDAGEPRTTTMADDPQTGINETGRYWLTNLPAGQHVVREVIPNGLVITFPTNNTHVVQLKSGGTVDGIDFGNQPDGGGSIHGFKWSDNNGNGRRDSNEPGLAGVTIYSDLNRNQVLDNDEPRTITMGDDPATGLNETGQYWLTNLPAGQHVVREVIPRGYDITFPINNSHVVQLNAGDTVDGLDFGNQPIRLGSIHGLKWRDDNGNGAREVNEPGLAGVTIYVDLNRNFVLDKDEPFTTTMVDDPATQVNETGRYWLTKLPAGQYVVREVIPDDFDLTFPKNNTHVVNLGPGDVVEGIDFGNQSTRPGSVHGIKWRDDNANGRRDSNEPGLSGVTIYVDLNRNQVLDAGEPRTITIDNDPKTNPNEAGRYWLTNLPAGEHVVREVVPDGFEQTFPVDNTHLVNVTPGDSVDGIDFGNQFIPLSSIHGIKWRDENGDGRRDSNEPGMAGVIIYVDVNRNHVLDKDEPFTITMGDDPKTHYRETGLYWLTDLPAGEHVVREVVPEGFEQTFPKDNTHVVQLKPGEVVEGIDFGNEPLRPGSIHGTKWLDDDGDGRRDANEPGLAGITVYVDLNYNGVLDKDEPRAITMRDDPDTDFDEAGLYWIDDIEPGLYVVREIVQDGFRQTFPGPLTCKAVFCNGNGHLVQVTSGDAIEGIDFGDQPIRSSSIRGISWRDDNGNGRRDTHERGYAGVTVYLDLNNNGELDVGEPQTVSVGDDLDTNVDELGKYSLTGFPAGDYLVREVVPQFFVQTYPKVGRTNLPAEAEVEPTTEVDPTRIDVELSAGEPLNTSVSWTFNPVCIRPFEVDVVASEPGALVTNLSGTQLNGCGGDTSVFDVRIVGIGLPQAFDLEFVDAEFGGLLGAIPVTIAVPGPNGGHFVHLDTGETARNIDFGNRSLFLPGDSDRDGDVDFTDYLRLSAYFRSSDATWNEADFNGDQRVLFDDFLNLAFNYGRSTPRDLPANAHDVALNDIDDATAVIISDDVIDDLSTALDEE